MRACPLRECINGYRPVIGIKDKPGGKEGDLRSHPQKSLAHCTQESGERRHSLHNRVRGVYQGTRVEWGVDCLPWRWTLSLPTAPQDRTFHASPLCVPLASFL